MSLPTIIINRQHRRAPPPDTRRIVRPYRTRSPPSGTAEEAQATAQAHQERRALLEPRRIDRPYTVPPSPFRPPSGPFTFTVSEPPIPHPGSTPEDQSRSRHPPLGAPLFPPALYDFPMTTRAMSDPDLMDIDPPENGPAFHFVDGFAGSDFPLNGHDTVVVEGPVDRMNGTGGPQQAAQAAQAAGVSQEQTTATMTASSRPKVIVPRCCTVCCEQDGDVTLTQPCSQCDASYCTDCLEDMFRTAIKDSTRMPPKCCSMLQLHVGLPHLTKEEATKYRRAFEEWMTTDRIYCPTPTCSAFIPDRLILQRQQRGLNKVFDCPDCNTTICEQCRQIAHQDSCDRSQTQYEEDLLKRFKMKRCPKCRTAVRRMYGCSHIECKCGAHWCYTCQMPIHECNGAHPEEFSGDEDEDDDEDNEEVPLEPNRGEDDDDDDSDVSDITEQDQIVRQTQVFDTHQEETSQPAAILAHAINDRPSLRTIMTMNPDESHQPVAHGHNPPGNTSALPDVVVDPTANIDEGRNGSPVTTPAVTDVGVPALDHDAGERRNNTPGTTPAVPEVDLDAGGRRRWAEEEDLDLGDEPSDEFLHLDVWSCKHKLKRVRINDNFPMVRKDTVLECNSCFTKLKPYSSSISNRRRKDVGTQTETSTLPPPQQQQQQQEGNRRSPVAVRQLLRPGGSLQPRVSEDGHLRAMNEIPYGCTICNVLYCGKCKSMKKL